jgi:hypothetical protein
MSDTAPKAAPRKVGAGDDVRKEILCHSRSEPISAEREAMKAEARVILVRLLVRSIMDRSHKAA